MGGFDLERLIDDFVLMCFFVGNDFLPHLPSLEIREGAIDTIFNLYKTIFPELGGWLTKDCNLNLNGVRLMMKELGALEDETLRKRRSKEATYERRMNQKKIQIQNKSNAQRHLQLIRKLTTNRAGMASAPTGQNLMTGGNISGAAAAGSAAGSGGEPAAKRGRIELESDAPAHLTHTNADAFRIKNRSVGGVRTLQPNAQEYDAIRLHMMDKIREFADKNGATPMKKIKLLLEYVQTTNLTKPKPMLKNAHARVRVCVCVHVHY